MDALRVRLGSVLEVRGSSVQLSVGTTEPRTLNL
jgi:hypothetical protein